MKPAKTSRRAFLSAGLILPVVGAGARMGLASTNTGFFKPIDGSFEETPTSSVKLEMRTLGRTGLKVTPVGFGCGYTGDASVVQRAADLGINYFDTARAYLQGNNERMLGAALGPRRKQIVLSTKSLASTKEKALEDLDTSLRELKTDYVDIWYYHDKPSPDKVTDGMIEAQQIAKQQGKIRFSGLSMHANQQQMLPWMAKNGVFDVVMTGYNFSMDASMDEAIAAAAKAGIGIVAMKVMAGGFRAIKPSSPLYSEVQAGRLAVGCAQVGSFAPQHRHHRSRHYRHGPVGRKLPRHVRNSRAQRRKDPLRASRGHQAALLPHVRQVRRTVQPGPSRGRCAALSYLRRRLSPVRHGAPELSTVGPGASIGSLRRLRSMHSPMSARRSRSQPHGACPGVICIEAAHDRFRIGARLYSLRKNSTAGQNAKALYQGTTSVVPKLQHNQPGFSP